MSIFICYVPIKDLSVYVYALYNVETCLFHTAVLPVVEKCDDSIISLLPLSYQQL